MTQQKKASLMRTTVGLQEEEEPCGNRRNTLSGGIDFLPGFSVSQCSAHFVGNSCGKSVNN
jgi:hypothetical protein